MNIRKEEISQTEVDNSVKHIKVNPLKREYGGKAGKNPKSQQRESNDSLKKRDVAVVHEAIVNSYKRPPLRKEESPQTEVDNSVKRIKVNPPKRENGGKEGKAPKSQQRESNDSLKKSDVAVVQEAIGNSYKRSPLRKEESRQTEVHNSVKRIKVNPPKRFSDKMNITKEESPQSEIDDFVKSIKMNPSKRKTTATYTPLDGSRHDTFETKMSNSSQMEPLHREGNSPDSCCHHQCHYQQRLTEHLEYEHDHPPSPRSFHVPNKDTTDLIFMLLCAILGVGLVHMLLLGYKFTH